MCGNEQESVLVQAVDTFQNVLEGKLLDLSDVAFEMTDVEVVFGDGVDLEFGLFLLFGFLYFFAGLPFYLFLFALTGFLLV
jgi:hypothetical protein